MSASSPDTQSLGITMIIPKRIAEILQDNPACTSLIEDRVSALVRFRRNLIRLSLEEAYQLKALAAEHDGEISSQTAHPLPGTLGPSPLVLLLERQPKLWIQEADALEDRLAESREEEGREEKHASSVPWEQVLQNLPITPRGLRVGFFLLAFTVICLILPVLL